MTERELRKFLNRKKPSPPSIQGGGWSYYCDSGGFSGWASLPAFIFNQLRPDKHQDGMTLRATYPTKKMATHDLVHVLRLK